MSTISFQSGLFRERAYISHSALSTAPSAMWMTPFSGPILRNKVRVQRTMDVRTPSRRVSISARVQ